MSERRAVHLVHSLQMIETVYEIDGGWIGFQLVKDKVTDIALDAGWPDWETVAERLEWRHGEEDWRGMILATFEVTA